MTPQRISLLGMISFELMLSITGCGGAESSSEEKQSTLPDTERKKTPPAKITSADSASGNTVASSGSSMDTPIPAPAVPENAPVLGDAYPALTDGALRHARLVDLPAEVLLQAEGVSVTKADLEKAPEQTRENAFFMLEQLATPNLLRVFARQRVNGAASLDEDQLLQHYFENMMDSISVSDAEVKAFYDENSGLVGNAPLEQTRDRIHNHLLQQKQQQLVEDHIAQLGKEMTVAVSVDWVAKQAPKALDNPVDSARGNGKPTFVNFGAKGCRPCDMMEPIREKLAEEYEGQLDVVFMHVREQQRLASRYGVRGIPHLVFFDADGKQVHTHTGFMPEEQIREWLQKIGVKDT